MLLQIHSEIDVKMHVERASRHPYVGRGNANGIAELEIITFSGKLH